MVCFIVSRLTKAIARVANSVGERIRQRCTPLGALDLVPDLSLYIVEFVSLAVAALRQQACVGIVAERQAQSLP
jgi:hypothetical protein